MVNRMVLNNVGYRPIRTALSVLAVTIEVVLILSVVGLVHGFLEERAQRQAGVRADIMVQPTGASTLLGMSSSPLLEKFVRFIQEKIPDAQAVTPVYVESFGHLTLAWGINVASFNAVSGGFTVLSGREIQAQTYDDQRKACSPGPACEVMVDNVYAASEKPPLKAGDTIALWNQPFTVVGVVASGVGARMFVPLRAMQQLRDVEGKCSVIYVKIADPGKNLNAVVERLKELMPGYPVYTMQEIYSLMVSGNIPGVKPFEKIMIGIAVVIGFLVIFMAMYTTVLERTGKSAR